MLKLHDIRIRRALLRLLIAGRGVLPACREVGISRTALHRYTVAFPQFKERLTEARAMRGRPTHEVESFIEQIADASPSPVFKSGEALPPPQDDVMTVEVMTEVISRTPGATRSKQAFYDRLWTMFEDENTPLPLRVEATRGLERHYIREDVLGPAVKVHTSRRPRGLSKAAKRETLHAIIGPPPAAVEDDEKAG